MEGVKASLGHVNKTWYLLFSMLCCLASACGPSYDEQQKQQELERRALQESKRAAEQKALDILMAKHNCLQFPYDTFTEVRTTYELQKLFRKAGNKGIAIKVNLVDLEDREDGMFAQFARYLMMPMRYMRILFDLKITREQAASLRALNHDGFIFDPMSPMSIPDCLIVARVRETRKISHESPGPTYADSESDIPATTVLASGDLVDFMDIPYSEPGMTEEEKENVKRRAARIRSR